MNRHMKKITVFVVSASMVIALSASPVVAVETSGRVIRELVEEVDKEMSRLEARVEGLSEESAALTRELGQKEKEFHATKDEMERQKKLADMLVICAKLNEQDLKEINAYKETLISLIPKMERLKGEIKKLGSMGFRKEEQFKRFRQRMGDMLTNAVRILRKLKEVSDDERVQQELVPIESTLATVYRMYESPLRPGPTSYAQVEKSIQGMENTFAQLRCVERVLEQERLRLKVENLNQLSRLALERLFRGRLGVSSIHEKPGKMMDAILVRSRSYAKAAGISYSGPSGSNGHMGHSPSTEAILNKIGEGNLFKD